MRSFRFMHHATRVGSNSKDTCLSLLANSLPFSSGQALAYRMAYLISPQTGKQYVTHKDIARREKKKRENKFVLAIAFAVARMQRRDREIIESVAPIPTPPHRTIMPCARLVLYGYQF